MSQSPDPTAGTPGAPSEPPSENSFFTSIRRTGMTRPAERWIGGVSGAVARKLDIDPLVVRVVLVASAFVVGIGLVLYGLAWALLPEESDGRIHVQELGRGNSDVALLGAAAFVVVGLTANERSWSLARWWDGAGLGWVNGLLWLAVVGVVVAIVVSGARQSGPSAPRPGPATAPPPAPHRASATSAAPEPRETTVTQTIAPPPPPAPTGPAVTPDPPAPPTPPVPGAGPRFLAVCAGLSLLVLAGLLLAERGGLFTGPVVLTALGATAVIFGAGIVVAGLVGRSSGVLGFFAVVSLLVAAPVAATSDVDLRWSQIDRWDGIGQSHHTPRSVAETAGGYAVGLGELRIDLTELDVPEGETVDLVLHSGVGNVELVLPPDDAARVAVGVGAGQAEWDVDGARSSTSGIGLRRTVTNAAATDGADLVFDVTVNVGVGNIDIVQED